MVMFCALKNAWGVLLKSSANNLNIATQQNTTDLKAGGGDNYSNSQSTKHQGSNLKVTGNLNISADNINIQGSLMLMSLALFRLSCCCASILDPVMLISSLVVFIVRLLVVKFEAILFAVALVLRLTLLENKPLVLDFICVALESWTDEMCQYCQ
jgi:hypothetical protein